MKTFLLSLCALLVANVLQAVEPVPPALAAEAQVAELKARVVNLESRVTQLSDKLNSFQQSNHYKDAAQLGAILCGVFCALWAQNTRRNAWLWFFLGLGTGPFALIAVLWKNRNDRLRRMLAGLE